jgi:hypothetical protein
VQCGGGYSVGRGAVRENGREITQRMQNREEIKDMTKRKVSE